MNKIYSYKIVSSDGEVIDFSNFKEKVILIVNTATQCGLATQFKDLENLHQKYKEEGLVVIGFPCNQFMGQEPVNNENMQSSCKINFGVYLSVNGKNRSKRRKYTPYF